MKRRMEGGRLQNKAGKRAGAFFCGMLTLLMLLLPAGTALAEEQPAYVLEDDVIEFAEIPALLRSYGPIAEQKRAQTDTFLRESAEGISALSQAEEEIRGELEDSISELKEQREATEDKELKALLTARISELERVKRSKKLLPDAGELSELNAALSTLSDRRETAEESEKRALRSIDRGFYNMEETARYQLQSLFFSYRELELKEEQLRQLRSTYQAAYELRKSMQAQGLSTALEVQQALLSLKEAENSMAQLQSGMDSMKRALGTALGWKAENCGNIRLGALPAYDLSFPDGRNPEADMEAVLQRNQEFGAALRMKDPNFTVWDHKEITLEETEQRLRMEVNAMYSGLLRKKAASEAAATSEALAALKRDRAERSLAAGLTGRTEYEALQLEYISKKAEAETARLQFSRAAYEYEQAVTKGIVTLGA